jgi:hypothetical protein
MFKLNNCHGSSHGKRAKKKSPELPKHANLLVIIAPGYASLFHREWVNARWLLDKNTGTIAIEGLVLLMQVEIVVCVCKPCTQMLIMHLARLLEMV